jgi:hypothetical protein
LRVAAGTKDPHTERSAEPTDIAPNSAGAHDACSLAASVIIQISEHVHDITNLQTADWRFFSCFN